MHNIEEKPRTQLVGVRFGYAGVIIGTGCAVVATVMNLVIGDGTLAQTGMSLGLIGAIAGSACAFIGWASNRTL